MCYMLKKTPKLIEKPHEKIIRDAVHGYIRISSKYVEKIIDTPNFQRLKRLEQTNVRPLYPSAHHDRFIHSLGVYHLGKIAFQFLEENSNKELAEHDFNWVLAQKNFELACLLHDVGHAPFSHTFEKYYDNQKKDGLDTVLLQMTLQIGKTSEDGKWKEESTRFYKEYKNTSAKEHEKISAILVLKEYFQTLSEISTVVDPFLIARMILGLTYENVTNDSVKQFYNCFISLLNSDYIDVDKLDYYARDQWATGHISKVLDFERLLSSLYIKKDSNGYVVCFHKRAITDILALIETKKLIDVSMHSHHLVKHDEYVLIEAIKEVSHLIRPNKDREETIREIISIKTLDKSKAHQVGKFKFQLLTDDDLIYILKHFMDQSKHAKEWFNRDYSLKAVWKTFADYKYFFSEFDDEQRKKLFESRETIVEEFLKQNGYDEKDIKNQYHIVIPKDTEYSPILTPKIKIFIKGKVVELKTLRDDYDEKKEKESKEKRESYFLLYLPKQFCVYEGARDIFIDFVIRKVTENK